MRNSDEKLEYLLEDYGRYVRINTLDEFLSETLVLPQQVAVRRYGFFHHFIYLEREIVDENTIKLTFIHKTNKMSLLSVSSVCSTLKSDFVSRVIKEELFVTHIDKKYEFKTRNKLLDFKRGVYFLGDHDTITREKAKERALDSINLSSSKISLYSAESFNCEHFSNWCFTENPVSYQSVKLKLSSSLADAGMNGAKEFFEVKSFVRTATPAVFQSLDDVIPFVGEKSAQIGTKLAYTGALSVIIQIPFETVKLTISSLKMKKNVEKGIMTQSDMNREVTKNVIGSAGSICGSTGAGVGGALIGTAICPGVGTIIGGIVGSIAGGLIGRSSGTLAGSAAYSAISNLQKNKNTKMESLM